jgi:hypothetical protein
MSGGVGPSLPRYVRDINDLYVSGLRYVRKARVRVKTDHRVGDPIRVVHPGTVDSGYNRSQLDPYNRGNGYW